MDTLALPTLLAHCTFERTATGATIAFAAAILAGSAVALFLLRRVTDRLWLRFLTMAAGVFLFELFTAPMWINERLGRWSYVYTDVSWILTIGWGTLFLGVVLLIDRYLPSWGARKRFAAYIVALLGPAVAAEILAVQLDIRSYAPEVLQSVSGIGFAGVPLEILYYVPVFAALVIAFYKYWSLVIDQAALVPVKKRKWLRAVGIAFLGVFFFDVLVEPVVVDRGFPAWSYVYRDVTLIVTGTRVLLIAIAAVLLNRLLLGRSIPQRFAAAVLFISALALPVESWWIARGLRTFGHSAAANFTGYTTYLTDLPVEIAFATPCYLALIVGFIRYWEIVLDNRL